MTRLLGLLFLLAFAPASFAQSNQTKCELTAAQFPAIRGFRLGMDLETVRREIQLDDLYKFEPQKLGFIKYDLPVYLNRDASDRFKGLRNVNLGFIDGALALLELDYNFETKWNSIDEFVEAVSKSLNLPAQWNTFSSAGRSKERILSCRDMQIEASLARPSPFLRLYKSDLNVTLRERQEKVEAEKRKTFTP